VSTPPSATVTDVELPQAWSRPAPRRERRRRLRLGGLRLRLLAGFVAVALLTAALIAGVSYVLTRRAVEDQTTQNAAQQFQNDLQVQSLALDDTNSMTSLQVNGALQAIATQLGSSDKMVVIAQTNGTTVTSSASITYADVSADMRTSIGHGSMVWQRIHIDGVPYLVMGAEAQSSGPALYEFVSLADDEETLNRLTENYGWAAGIALAGAALLALFAAQGVLRPIRRLGFAARRLGEGHLDTRAEVHGSDEIADVARTFNETASALEQGVAELRAMEAASRRFVADVSHELRTPLTAMTAVTDVLEDATDVGDETAPAARLIVTETKRLARLVEDLIEVSRFDAGTAALRLEQVDFVELVEASLHARGWSGSVKKIMPERLPARVDPRRIDVVIANLAGNALKHGGVPVTLELVARDGEILLQVRDNGPGIPADALPHVFERFYKADKARGRSEGSGLGLSIAYENARMHDGELMAANGIDSGAVFTLRLPHAVVPLDGDDAEPVEGV
jgi:two-component system sensor histidine kinase MtrB